MKHSNKRGPDWAFRWLDRMYCRHWQRLEGDVFSLPEGPL